RPGGVAASRGGAEATRRRPRGVRRPGAIPAGCAHFGAGRTPRAGPPLASGPVATAHRSPGAFTRTDVGATGRHGFEIDAPHLDIAAGRPAHRPPRQGCLAPQSGNAAPGRTAMRP